MTLKQQALRIRMIEEEIARRYPEQEIRCPIHLSIGQEAQAVGVCAALNINDKMVSTHRGHAHYLAKGGDLGKMVAELYGRSTGCSGGNGGSMHLIDESVGFMGSTSIVGSSIPVGVGLAFADKLKGERHATVIMMGDAAIEEGVFHESANFASLHKLKVVFVIEDNDYSCFTHTKERRPMGVSASSIAQMHGLNFWHLDSQDPEIIKDKMQWCIEHAPSVLVLKCWRNVQHCGPDQDDHLNYRSLEDREHWNKRDLLGTTAFDPAIIIEIENEIKGAFDAARA